ncbi:MAG: OmpA family protein [Desulfobulbaceae bacterium]|nr:OmpA family protein [Desulfobulbaceae bacterium]HIJ78656.1 OmpA family protein [Deltaproteobacteria bacterium]
MAVRQTIKSERNLLKRKDLLVEAIKVCPKDPVVNFMYGYSLERLRKYEDALNHYLIAAELDKNYADAFSGMGDIYMVLGNVDSAVAAYEKGLALDGKDKRTARSLELAQIKLKAQSGGAIKANDFVNVMKNSKTPAENAIGSVEGPLLRMLIIFPDESAELSDDAKDQLSLVVGRALLSPALADAHFEIGGHTDAGGNSKANMEMSRGRAQAVKDYLVDNFNINPERLQVAAYGDSRPVMPNDSSANRNMNRRVEFKRLK